MVPNPAISIEIPLELEEQQARIFAGLGMQEYAELPGDPAHNDGRYAMSKAEVVVLHRVSRDIAAVVENSRVKKGK